MRYECECECGHNLNHITDTDTKGLVSFQVMQRHDVIPKLLDFTTILGPPDI